MAGIPPELMQLIAGGAGKKGAPPMPQGAPGAPGAGPQTPGAPGGSPMATPEPAQGEKQSAYITIGLAGDLLEQSLPAIGSESPEGQVILDCLTKLSKTFGHTKAKSAELHPAELMQLFQSLPQAGGMSPEAKAMGQKPIQVPGMPQGAGGGGMPGGGQPMPQAA